MNLSQIIGWQATHGWLVFYAPLSFIIFLVASFAETNRMPFDLPEAETELVGGYNTEYSSMKFALFFLGEYSNMIASAAHDGDAVFRRLDAAVLGTGSAGGDRWAWASRTFWFFWRRCCLFMVVFIWVRWMFPRFRYDQLMDLGWRRFVPLALVNILVTAVDSVDEELNDR